MKLMGCRFNHGNNVALFFIISEFVRSKIKADKRIILNIRQMKKNMIKINAILFFTMVLSCAVVYAQDYQISFAGTGAATIIENVEVQNLTQATSLMLGQGDILHLKRVVTGVDNVKRNNDNMTIYPNPIKESGNIEFIAQMTDICTIEVYNLMGEKVLNGQYNLTQGDHQFKISGLQSGIYSVKIQSDNYSYSGKIVSKANSQGQVNITYNAQTRKENESLVLKSSTAGNLIEMSYVDGDRLLITATTGIYSSVISIIPIASTTETMEFAACTDGDGNNYKIVKIGEQTWMAENLRTTKFNDGTDIPLITSDDDWGIDNLTYRTTPAYCWYDNNQAAAVANGYGALYDWNSVDTDKLCPTGWHVPTTTDWNSLENYLIANGYNFDGTITGNGIAKALATASGWIPSNFSGSVGSSDYPSYRNKTGFSALPGGFRSCNTGVFAGAGLDGFWWTSSVCYSYSAFSRRILNIRVYLYGDQNPKSTGYSVRCIRD